MSSSERAPRPSRFAGIEAAIVFTLVMLYIWRLRFRYPYSWVAILALVLASHWLRREGFRKLGFRWNSPPRGFATALAVFAIVLLSAGALLHTIRQVSWQGAVVSLALYSIWGLVQQYLLNGYFVNRFSEVGAPAGLAPLLAAIAFSLVHLPNWFLMIVTLAGGYICARIYLAHRNLYILGAAHGIIGFLIYFTVPDTISHHLYVGPKWFYM